MKCRKFIVGWVGVAIACIVALGVGYVWGESSIEGRFSDRNAVEIFRALLSYEGEISRNNCENEILKVPDFVSSYLDQSFVIEKSSSRGFVCNGVSLLECKWGFGKDVSNEAWGRFLKFNYDPVSKKITPGSVSCLDVP